MKNFVGGPFSDGCHEAVLKHLGTLRGESPTVRPDEPLITDDDYHAIMSGSRGSIILDLSKE